jgi:hypothetical protein
MKKELHREHGAQNTELHREENLSIGSVFSVLFLCVLCVTLFLRFGSGGGPGKGIA